MIGMVVPSGRTLDDEDLMLIRDMKRYGFVQWSENPFTLKSGIESRVYVFGREDLTDNPSFLNGVGRKIGRSVIAASEPGDLQPCLVGIPTAGTAMAIAAASVDSTECAFDGQRHRIACRVMREGLKSYGAHKAWVNGKPDTGRHTYWTVDNVVTNADSKFETEERLIQDGYPAFGPSLIFVDRQQGGVERMRTAGFDRIVVCYYLLDIVFALGQLHPDVWRPEIVASVEKEISEHQFVAH